MTRAELIATVCASAWLVTMALTTLQPVLEQLLGVKL